jgi:hypothetical protein
VALKILRQAGLREQGVGPRVQSALRDRGERVAGKDHNGDLSGSGVLLESLGRHDAVESWHRQIHHDQIGLVTERDFDTSFTVLSGHRAETATLKVKGVEFAGVGVIVHDQDESGAARAREPSLSRSNIWDSAERPSFWARLVLVAGRRWRQDASSFTTQHNPSRLMGFVVSALKPTSKAAAAASAIRRSSTRRLDW